MLRILRRVMQILQIMSMLLTIGAANHTCECIKPPIFPKGEWIKTALNPRINGNLLCADLKPFDKSDFISIPKYTQSCIIFEENDILFNFDGQFSKKVTKNPPGSWVDTAKDITLHNNILCASLRTCRGGEFRKTCIMVKDDDILENNLGSFQRTRWL